MHKQKNDANILWITLFPKYRKSKAFMDIPIREKLTTTSIVNQDKGDT